MSYIVASPGRTGSIFLATFLQHYSSYQTGRMTYMYTVQREFRDLEDLPSNFVIHCHQVEAIELFAASRKLFLITRNPIEITASYLIAELTGTFHFGNFDANQRSRESYIQNYQHKTFHLDPQYFISYLKYNCEWYVSAYQHQHATLINYKNVTNLDHVNTLLDNRDFVVDWALLPQAQPFDKWSKIENADLIRKIGTSVFDHYRKMYPHIFTEDNFS